MGARIERVLVTQGLACDYYKDVAAIDGGAEPDGLFFTGPPVTAGFTAVRERAPSLSIQLVLSDGTVGVGDCVSVIRAGSHDREPPLRPGPALDEAVGAVEKALVGAPVTGFRELTALVEDLPTPVAYGASQAVLDAVAAARRETMAEVVAAEYGLPRPSGPVPVFGATSWDTPNAVDRLIAGRADVLPHGGFTAVGMVGQGAQDLVGYLRAVARRIDAYGGPGYHPVLHVDVYGTLGDLVDGDVPRLAALLDRLADAAAPYRLRVEDPVLARTAEESRTVMARLVEAVRGRVDVVADEYCNTARDVAAWAAARAADMIHVKPPDLGPLTRTVEALLGCRAAGTATYLGGTMNDTEVSARAGVHVALALGVDQVMARPGAWPDVALALTHNEMHRALARARPRSSHAPA